MCTIELRLFSCKSGQFAANYLAKIELLRRQTA